MKSKRFVKAVGAVSMAAVMLLGGYAFADDEIVGSGETDIIYVTGVTLEEDYAYLTVGGESVCLTAHVDPPNASNQGLIWTSSNEGIAVVSDEGEVSPVGVGICTITVTTEEGGFSAECRVSVEVAVSAGWNQIDGKWYYYDESLVMQTGWLKDGNKWYLLGEDGVMLTGWQQVNSKWYYLSGSGAMVTGWKKIGSYWFYFNGGGDMVTGWKKVSGKWYYFNASGSMKTGWLKLDGKWYYLESSGAMVTGSRSIGGKMYNFNSSGVCTNP